MAGRIAQLEATVAQLQAELGIDELAGVEPASTGQAEALDLGEVLDLDNLDQPVGAEVDGLGGSYDEYAYPDLDAAINAEAVRMGGVDPESLALTLADDYWPVEDIIHDIIVKLDQAGYELLNGERGLWIAPDFGALLDEVQDLRNLSQDAYPPYREYAATEIQRRRARGMKCKAPYVRRPQAEIDRDKAAKLERDLARYQSNKPAVQVQRIDWAAIEQEPVVARVAV